MSLFRQDKVFEYKGEVYTFEKLSELKRDSPFYKDGDVTFTETGEMVDISELHKFVSTATNNIVKKIDKIDEVTLSEPTVRDVKRKIYKESMKDNLKDLELKIENETITLEEIIAYWDTKNQIKTKEFTYSFKIFVKININEIAMKMLRDLSIYDRGRVMCLIDLIEFKENNASINREELMKLMEYKEADSLKQFLSRIEKSEIIKRRNKNKRNTLDIFINPFIFSRLSFVPLTTTLYEYFPKSCEAFLDKDEYMYLKLLYNNGISKVEVNGISI